MTRVNYGIDPKILSNRHLLAELREIKRIPNCIKSGKYDYRNATNIFKLGTGHVKFFYDKLGYIKYRWCFIALECVKRGFTITDYSDAFVDLPEAACRMIEPQVNDRSILWERLLERDYNHYSRIDLNDYEII